MMNTTRTILVKPQTVPTNFKFNYLMAQDYLLYKETPEIRNQALNYLTKNHAADKKLFTLAVQETNNKIQNKSTAKTTLPELLDLLAAAGNFQHQEADLKKVLAIVEQLATKDEKLYNDFAEKNLQTKQHKLLNLFLQSAPRSDQYITLLHQLNNECFRQGWQGQAMGLLINATCKKLKAAENNDYKNQTAKLAELHELFQKSSPRAAYSDFAHTLGYAYSEELTNNSKSYENYLSKKYREGVFFTGNIQVNIPFTKKAPYIGIIPAAQAGLENVLKPCDFGISVGVNNYNVLNKKLDSTLAWMPTIKAYYNQHLLFTDNFNDRHIKALDLGIAFSFWPNSKSYFVEMPLKLSFISAFYNSGHFRTGGIPALFLSPGLVIGNKKSPEFFLNFGLNLNFYLGARY